MTPPKLHWRPAVAWLFILTLIALHHDFWFWNRIDPMLWGWAPVALWYHAALTVLCIPALYLLGRWVWPPPPVPDGSDRSHFPSLSPDPSEPADSDKGVRS
jgi:hypothetical protein